MVLTGQMRELDGKQKIYLEWSKVHCKNRPWVSALANRGLADRVASQFQDSTTHAYCCISICAFCINYDLYLQVATLPRHVPSTLARSSLTSISRPAHYSTDYLC